MRGLSPRSDPDRPCIELTKRGGVLNRTQIFILFFDTMLLSAHVERVSASRVRDFFCLHTGFDGWGDILG